MRGHRIAAEIHFVQAKRLWQDATHLSWPPE
jgi:hypothetical protein